MAARRRVAAIIDPVFGFRTEINPKPPRLGSSSSGSGPLRRWRLEGLASQNVRGSACPLSLVLPCYGDFGSLLARFISLFGHLGNWRSASEKNQRLTGVGCVPESPENRFFA